MGTRSILEFSDSSAKVQIYRHWDGYPKDVLPDLEKFFVWNGQRSSDLSYTIANFFLWSKLDSAKVMEQSAKEMFDKPSHNDGLHTGFGIIPTLCQDSELESYEAKYFYRIGLASKNFEIKVYDVTQNGIQYIGNCFFDTEKNVLFGYDEELTKALKS